MDYTYPSVFFSYFLFFLFLFGAIFFCVRSLKRGYWSTDSENVKYHVFDDQVYDQKLYNPQLYKKEETPHGR